jgi:hypothetical protein
VLLRRVALVRTDVLEEPSSLFIRVTRIGELGITLAVTSIRRTLRRNTKCLGRLLVTASVVPSSQILATLMKEALSSSETSVLTRATQRHIPGHTILHSHRRETSNLTRLIQYSRDNSADGCTSRVSSSGAVQKPRDRHSLNYENISFFNGHEKET